MLRRHIKVVVGASRVELEIGWRARPPWRRRGGHRGRRRLVRGTTSSWCRSADPVLRANVLETAAMSSASGMEVATLLAMRSARVAKAP